MSGNGDTAQRLREAGLRVTRPRVAVYEALHRLGGHHSVDDVVRALRARDQDVTRMSVYNVVADLRSAGLILAADIGPGRAVYEVADAWHHHFVCRRCEAIVDVPCTAGRKPCLHPRLTGAKIDEAQVIFRGLCPSCAGRVGKRRARVSATPRRR